MTASRAGRFRFRAGGAETEVLVGEGAFEALGARLSRIAPGRWFVVSSRPVFRRHGAALLAAVRGGALDPAPLLGPDGEAAKSWSVLGRLLSGLSDRGLRRDGGLVALGGGTVGDVAGLAAALALRGVPVVQVPTTLLAAADSALGGKTAVDLPAGKNLAGAFHMPRLVAVEPAVFATLPPRAFRSGLAEVVKSALLSRTFFRAMPRLAPGLARRDAEALAEAVRRSLAMKAAVVTADPFERLGRRFALNLGHTVGHALEAASGYRLTHGEAVAWGLLAALRLSELRAGLSPPVAAAARRWIADLVRPPRPPAAAIRSWASRLAADKKADREGLVAVLLAAPGRAVPARVAPRDLVTAFEANLASYNHFET
ncbi:MAG TPA: 3-dehydroquinate synthase family protein [Thermoanaerobaculia bacterium]|nr:3-dehydroquinate synthase family protein [Thermoanaerobaculia bacterium]